MAFGGRGGCVITTLGRNRVKVSEKPISQDTLRKIAEYLGVTDFKEDETIRTIFYVTPAPPPPPAKE